MIIYLIIHFTCSLFLFYDYSQHCKKQGEELDTRIVGLIFFGGLPMLGFFTGISIYLWFNPEDSEE